MAQLRRTRLFWTILMIVGVAMLGWLAATSHWPIADNGHVTITDFATVWAAGVRALSGEPGLVYDLAVHEAYYAALIHQPPASGLTFGYPPTAFLLYAPFGLAPYGLSLLVYLLGGAGLWFWTLRGIVKDASIALPMTLAWGGATHTVMLGQNGFLAASALAGGLLLLERKPIWAGILFGLLAMKPHLGPALALFLLVRRDWVAIAATVCATAVMVAATVLLWGTEVWSQYLAASREIASIVGQRTGSIVAHKMQSVFAMAVDHVPVAAAFAIHAVVALISLGVMILTVVRKAEFPVQMAAVIVATLLVTPYSFLYDCTVLTAAAGCLLTVRPNRDERWLVLGAIALPGMWFLTAEPFVPLACLGMLALCWTRSRKVSPIEGPRSAAARPAAPSGT